MAHSPSSGGGGPARGGVAHTRTSPPREMPDQSQGAEVATLSLRTCLICERKFRDQIFAKHVKRCEANAKKKPRKKFKVEVVSSDELLRQGVDKRTQKERVKKEAKRLEQKKANGPSRKWRQQSDQLRAITNIDNPRSSSSSGYSGAGAPAYAEPTDDRVGCPHCSRKFSEESATRHIPICAKRSKDQAMNRRAVRGGGAKGVRSLKKAQGVGGRGRGRGGPARARGARV